MPITAISPTLGQILPIDRIPERFEGIRSFLESILDEVFVTNLVVGKSELGESGTYTMRLVVPEGIALNLPFVEDLALVLNPNELGQSTLDFAMDYQWLVLKYIQDFSLTDFSATVDNLIGLLMEFLELEEEDLLAEALSTFFPEGDGIMDFIDSLSSTYGVVVSGINDETTPFIEKVAIIFDAIEESELDTIQIILESFINDIEEFDPMERLQALFSEYINDIEEVIAEILEPEFSASLLDLSIGLQFPRKWLVPVYTGEEDVPNLGINDPLPDEYHTYLSFEAGSLLYNSGIGFQFENIGSFSINRSRIGNTGLIVEVTDLKVDLSSNRNIPEANNDNRPNSFKGFYADNVAVSFPSFLEGHSDNSVEIYADRLLVGSEGGVSGVFGIRGINSGINMHYLDFIIRDDDANSTDVPEGIRFDHDRNKILVYGEDGLSSSESIFDVITYDTEQIYIQDAEGSVYLFSPGTQNIENVTESYKEGVFLRFNIGDTVLSLNTFVVVMHQNEVQSSQITGKLTNPSFENELDVKVDISNGFQIIVTGEEYVVNNQYVSILLQSLQLGNLGGLWNFGISTEITQNINLPVIGDILPQLIDINHFNFVETQPADFDILLKWSNGIEAGGTDEGGFYGTVPLDLNIANVLFLDKVKLRLDVVDEGMDLYVTFIGAALILGFIGARADGIGFKARIRKSDQQGLEGGINFGETNVDLKFIPPTGLQIAIIAGAVRGSGYLFLDYDNKRYFGYLELVIADKFEILAIGILNKIPETDKNSFLALVNMELPKPIPVGFGFDLTDVGGLAGINRGMDTDAMRAGVKTGALDNIMFPEDPVNEITTIIGDLEQIFPVIEGEHSFGLMARFKNSAVITVDLAFMLSMPAPIVVAIAGVVKAEIKGDSPDLMRVKSAFLLVADFRRKLLTIDASIYDSKIAGLVIQGDFALRYSWGNEKFFLISAGGFHPLFQVSEDYSLGSLNRIAAIVVDKVKDNGDIRRVYGAVYTAVTSNTFQFGVRVDALFTYNKVGVEAYFGLDTLFKFNPFKMIADVAIGAGVTYKGKSLLGVYLNLNVQGPKPWILKGKAEIKIIIKIKVNIDVTIGDNDNAGLETIDVMPLIVAELAEDRSYSAVEELQRQPAVIHRNSDTDDSTLVLDPNGHLRISQNIAPLEFTINKYGENPTTAEERYYITSVESDGEEVNTLEQTHDYFAPNQYVKASNTEKLKAKSYELLDSGKIIGSDDFGMELPQLNQSRLLQYELVYADQNNEGGATNLGNVNEKQLSEKQLVQVKQDVLKLMHGGAYGKADGFKLNKKKKSKKGKRVRMRDFEYGIAKSKTIKLKDSQSKGYTYHKAQDVMRQLENEGTIPTKEFRVMPSYEYREGNEVAQEVEIALG